MLSKNRIVYSANSRLQFQVVNLACKMFTFSTDDGVAEMSKAVSIYHATIGAVAGTGARGQACLNSAYNDCVAIVKKYPGNPALAEMLPARQQTSDDGRGGFSGAFAASKTAQWDASKR